MFSKDALNHFLAYSSAKKQSQTRKKRGIFLILYFGRQVNEGVGGYSIPRSSGYATVCELSFLSLFGCTTDCNLNFVMGE